MTSFTAMMVMTYLVGDAPGKPGGNDHFDGGAGNDTVDFSTSNAGVTANLTTGVASGNGSDTFDRRREPLRAPPSTMS